jgi:AmmeMemoRadiSam system protein A
MGSENPTLTRAERQFLRLVAGRAVEAAARSRPAPDPREMAREAGLDLEPRLTALRGAFVTLTSAGTLRGCIGYIEGIKPLVDAVVENGRSAAISDPRFPPVEAKELPHLEIEVSALTPLAAVDGPEGIVIGRHGVVLAKAGHRAVFLPQVAVEQGWNLETTLTHLALKAGLGPDGWREGADFLVFEADVF